MVFITSLAALRMLGRSVNNEFKRLWMAMCWFEVLLEY